MIFKDRAEAGRALAARLMQFSGRSDAVVLALPHGGVPVGFEVARALGLPLDIFIVRSLPVPGHPNLTMGYVTSGDVLLLYPDVVHGLRISDEEVQEVAGREQRQLEQIERLYRGERAPLGVHGRTLILVDEGLVPGSSIRAAALALRDRSPAWVSVAVPVAAPGACTELAREVDEVACVATPDPFISIAHCYREFPEVSDEQIRALLERSNNQVARAA